MLDKLLTADEVATLLGVPVKTLYRWRWLGKAPRAVKVGRHLRFRQADVEQWLDGQETATGGQS